MQTCPLCNKKSNCQINNERSPACWCTMWTFPKTLYKKLEGLPDQCICSACAKKLGAYVNK